VKKTQEVGSRIFLTRGRNVASKVFGSNRAWKCVEKQNSLPLKTYKDFLANYREYLSQKEQPFPCLFGPDENPEERSTLVPFSLCT
jgi:hypothetical protein